MIEGISRLVRSSVGRLVELSPNQLNLSWVTPELAVGGAFDSFDAPRLRRLGIRAIVDCRAEASDDVEVLARHEISFLRLPTPDNHELAQSALDEGVSWANNWLAAGARVFVHCAHGIGRAPLLVSCILVSRGYSPNEALTLIKSRRWQAAPNEEQLAAILTFNKRHAQAALH